MKYFLIAATFVSSVLAGNNYAGIAASNSLGGRGSYTCRSQGDWNNLARTSRDNGFKSIFVTGFDCDAIFRASQAAADHGLTVLAGIYITGSVAGAIPQINYEVSLFREAYNRFGSGRFIGLNIGNEANDNSGAIMAKVYDVRGYLRSVGVNTPVSTAHTWVRIKDDPALCGADYVSANAHVYFDGQFASNSAGYFLKDIVVPELKRACPGKKIIISETGWPSRGGNNGRAVASQRDQTEAHRSINCSARDMRDVSVYAFEADDQHWKGNDVERSFGIYGKVGLNDDIFRTC